MGQNRKTIEELTREEKSAIIGYWRNGMKMESIAALMGLYVLDVEKIINDYKNKTHQ